VISVAAVLLVTHGAAVGEVTDRSAVLWARSNAPAEMVVAYGEDGVARGRSEAAHDLEYNTTKIVLRNKNSDVLLVFQAGNRAKAGKNALVRWLVERMHIRANL